MLYYFAICYLIILCYTITEYDAINYDMSGYNCAFLKIQRQRVTSKYECWVTETVIKLYEEQINVWFCFTHVRGRKLM